MATVDQMKIGLVFGDGRNDPALGGIKLDEEWPVLVELLCWEGFDGIDRLLGGIENRL